MMVFRVLKWLALAWAILFVIVAFGASAETTDKVGVVANATPMILFAIFFHLEQHKS